MTRYAGKQLPDGVIIDSEGNPTTDPAAFYGPPEGALLPLGGIVGHRVRAEPGGRAAGGRAVGRGLHR